MYVSKFDNFADIFESGCGLFNRFCWMNYEYAIKLRKGNHLKIERREIEVAKYPTMEEVAKLLAQEVDTFTIKHLIKPLLQINCIGGEEHTALSLLASSWLLDQGLEPASEVYRIDISTPDLKWAIECGNSNPERVMEHLYAGYEYSAVLPFQFGNWWPRTMIETLTLVVFQRSETWCDEFAKNLFNPPLPEYLTNNLF